MSSSALKRLSVTEYLAIERAALTKSEFLDGEMFAMADASHRHCRIAMNIAGEAWVFLKGGPCQVLGSDMRVKTPSELYTYPDVVVLCSQPEFEGTLEDILLNPQVIIEVLSPSTEAFDRGRKRDHYWSISTLREYILVSQEEVAIERHTRESANRWLVTKYTDLQESLEIASLGISISLAEVYSQVTFDPPTSEP